MLPTAPNAMPGDGTAAQLQAANPGESIWVSANAGTGKTWVLTNRIARLLIDGTPPSRILCLTFTKAAAAEMANRLSDRLGAWAAIEDTHLDAALEELFGRHGLVLVVELDLVDFLFRYPFVDRGKGEHKE